MLTETDLFIVTATPAADPLGFVRFTWNEEMTECTFVAVGDFCDAALEALLAADVHEGANLEGWTVTTK